MNISEENLLAALRASTLCRGHDEESLTYLASIAHWKHTAGGESILNQQDEGHDLFVLVSGTARIIGVTGEPIGTIGEGMPIGEVAFLDGKNRSGTVLAETDCACIQLPSEQLRQALHDSTKLSVALLWSLAQILCHRLRSTNQHLDVMLAIEEAQHSPSDRS